MTHVRDSQWAGAAAAVAVVAAVTAVLYPLQELDPGVSSGVLYVLGVLVLSVTWGLRLGLATSFASALALWIFHTSPSAGLDSIEAQDIAAIAVLLVTEIVAAVIADRARSRVQDAEERLALAAVRGLRLVAGARILVVRASRAGVIAGGAAERKRVVRDLHDGAQQQLVHTVIRLKLTQRALERGDGAEGLALVTQALSHAEGAVTELRDLSHGILPAALLHGGLPAAIEALADRTSIPVAVEVFEGRLAPAVEATAYFVVAEALTNVAKHSGATRAEACAVIDDRCLVLTVSDDGHGGARDGGNGLTGLRDRLAALSGQLRVGDRDGGGTVLRATIPLAA
jgi:signal transduction histidine kinase